MSFFSAGRVDTTRFDRNKLPCGPKNTDAVYRVRLTDLSDHFGCNGGDRTQFNFTITDGPKAGGTGAELVMHGGYAKAWMADKARGTIAITLGAFAGMTADKAGFKVTNEFFQENSRSQQYNGNTVASKTREASDLPLVKANAEAFLVVKPYFEKKDGKLVLKDGKPVRKLNPKTKQPSVTYEFFPLSANLAISDEFETQLLDADEEEAPEVTDEPEVPTTVDALALALAAGWKPNGTSGYYYNSKDKSAKQLKEAALRAQFGG